MPIHEALERRQALTGTMLRLIRQPAVAMMVKRAGMDLLIIDLEHGTFGWGDLEPIVATSRVLGLGVLVRIAELSRGNVLRALECGGHGVVAPMIETAEQARDLVAWSRYMPEGCRGLGTIGAHTDFEGSSDVPAFMARMNQRVFVVAQIETRQGADNAGQIAAVPGLDMVLVGPNDLANSIGTPGDLFSQAEEDAIGRIAQAVAQARIILGMHGPIRLLQRWKPHGLRCFIHSIDTAILDQGVRDVGRLLEELVTESA